MITKIIRSFIIALKGLRHAYVRDASFRIEVWAGFILVATGYFAWPISQAEFLFLALSYMLVLLTELINTSLEQALERLHPDHHHQIGAAKDIASAAVFVAVLFAGVVVASIATTRLF